MEIKPRLSTTRAKRVINPGIRAVPAALHVCRLIDMLVQDSGIGVITSRLCPFQQYSPFLQQIVFDFVVSYTCVIGLYSLLYFL